MQNTRRGISVGLEVVAHEAVGVFGFRFDIGRRGERFGVLQQADGRFLLGLPAAEAGGVLVMSVGGKTVRSQGNTELPCGRILDGEHRKLKVGVNLNVHCVNCL